MAFVKGKVALVTGGASGIGLGIAKNLLLSDAKGVTIVDISEENGTKVTASLQREYGDKIMFIRADVTKEEDLKNAFERTIKKYKNIDIVCNNAGIVDEMDWEKTVAVNLTAVVRGTYLALYTYLPTHKTGKEAVIVNTASILGINTTPSIPTYCATKHGVVGLGKALGDDGRYNESGIRVLTVCPGVVKTALQDTASVDDADKVKNEIDSLSEKSSSPDYLGKSVIQIINEGQNGSVWVAEDEKKPYEVIFMNRVHIKKK